MSVFVEVDRGGRRRWLRLFSPLRNDLRRDKLGVDSTPRKQLGVRPLLGH
jgi:hypothetical protein